jgi:anti-sigma factor RsiW
MSAQNHRIAAYVDGELSAEEAAELEALFAAEPAAREAARIQQEMMVLLRAACAEPFYAERAPQAAPRRAAVPWRRWPLQAAAAVLLVAAGFAASQYVDARASSAHAQLLDEVADYHRFFSRYPDHLAEVPPARADELAAWMRGVGLDVAVPDLSRLGYAFAGGRLYVVDRRPIAELFYAAPGQVPIGLCVTERGEEGRDIALEAREDLNTASWAAGQHTFVVVGRLGADEARDIARAIAGLPPRA